MSTEMNRYNKGLIYKLCCLDPEITDIYVGSTCNFKRRKGEHKSRINDKNDAGYNKYSYQFIREHGGWENWDMIEIEKFSCETKRELETRERYWLEYLGATLNKFIPTRTDKEWQEANKERLKVMHRKWYEDNIETVREKGKIYREANKERKKEVNKNYRESNKEKISKKQKEYREANKERLSEKITCECGSIVCKGGLNRHKKTKKHQDYINSLQ